jgi:homogentisate 1,2-dioxygenase
MITTLASSQYWPKTENGCGGKVSIHSLSLMHKPQAYITKRMNKKREGAMAWY